MTVLVDEPDAEVVASVDRCLDVETPGTFAGHPISPRSPASPAAASASTPPRR